MNILALDLGTNTGFAYNYGEQFFCGTWKLASDKEIADWGKNRLRRRADPRVCCLADYIESAGRMDAVIFEDVQFGSTTYQTQLWASFRAVIWLNACQNNAFTVFDCVSVGTLKKFATGAGNATKTDMAEALVRQNTRFCKIGKINPKFFYRKTLEQLQEIDDNCVDAIWLWKWGQKNLARKPGI